MKTHSICSCATCHFYVNLILFSVGEYLNSFCYWIRCAFSYLKDPSTGLHALLV